MASDLYELEMRSVDLMSRQQLLDAIRPRLDCLPNDLRERLDDQPDGWLRLLLMAARLVWALRLLRDQHWAEKAPPG
jgi:hypothetical protein